MRKTIITAILLTATTSTVQAVETYSAKNIYILDTGQVREHRYFYVDNVDLPIPCPGGMRGMITIRTQVTEPGAFGDIYDAWLLGKPVPAMTFLRNSQGTRCVLKEVKQPEEEEWSIQDLYLHTKIREKRFWAQGCPDPLRSGQIGYLYKTRAPGDILWGPEYGGRMEQVDGTTCMSGPFDIRTGKDEVKWRINTARGEKTRWVTIRD